MRISRTTSQTVSYLTFTPFASSNLHGFRRQIRNTASHGRGHLSEVENHIQRMKLTTLYSDRIIEYLFIPLVQSIGSRASVFSTTCSTHFGSSCQTETHRSRESKKQCFVMVDVCLLKRMAWMAVPCVLCEERKKFQGPREDHLFGG